MSFTNIETEKAKVMESSGSLFTKEDVCKILDSLGYDTEETGNGERDMSNEAWDLISEINTVIDTFDVNDILESTDFSFSIQHGNEVILDEELKLDYYYMKNQIEEKIKDFYGKNS